MALQLPGEEFEPFLVPAIAPLYHSSTVAVEDGKKTPSACILKELTGTLGL
jgi:hypothetical protein